MYFTISPEKSIKFKRLFENINDINDNINIYLRKNQLYIQGMDTNRICLFEINLNDSWFYEYSVDTEAVVGVNLTIINKILSCREKTQELKFEIDEAKPDKIIIHMINGMATDKIFESSTYDYDYDIFEITNINSDVDITMNAHLLNTIVGQIAIFGDTLSFNCHDAGISLTSKENKMFTTMNAEITIDKIKSYETTDEEQINDYNITYFSKLCKFSKLMEQDDLVEIKMGRDVPIIMKYMLEMPENEIVEEDDDETVVSNIIVCLAPKIVDEDEDE